MDWNLRADQRIWTKPTSENPATRSLRLTALSSSHGHPCLVLASRNSSSIGAGGNSTADTGSKGNLRFIVAKRVPGLHNESRMVLYAGSAQRLQRTGGAEQPPHPVYVCRVLLFC